MHTDNFEKAFEIFIDGKEYDATQQSIFELVRSAFAAGWAAARAEIPIRILPPAEGQSLK